MVDAHITQMGQKAIRVLMVGMDSSTLRLLTPLINAGELPTLERLVREGGHGVLLSSIPAVTPPGWVTSFTGVNPGKHNIFDFKDHTRYLNDPTKTEMASTTSRTMMANPFWRILEVEGLSTGLVNVPMIYPVEAINGYSIAGFPCPTEGEGLYYPPEIEDEVREVVPDYRFYGNPEYLTNNQPEKYLNDINRISEGRAEAAIHLMGRHPTDVVFFIFTEVDRIQHFFWNTYDENHPTHNPTKARFKRAIPGHYRVIDRSIAKMMDIPGPDTYVLLYSDHGAASVTKRFYPNTFLIMEDIIRMKGSKNKGTFQSKEEKAGKVKESRLDRRRAERIMKRMGIGRWIHRIPKSIRTFLPTKNFETVDWSATKAFFSSASAQSFTINLRGREPEGWIEPGREYEEAVEEVIGVLERLQDPETGKCPFASIHQRQDIWDGPYVENGPDIITVPAEGYVAHKDIREYIFEDVGQGWRDRSADHEREGVVILWGPGVRKGVEMGTHNIEDIAPTVLHMCGVAVPRYMDGKVMEDAFEEDWLREHPVTYTGDGTFIGRETEGPQMSAQEEEVLKERLRGLGYLG